MSDADASSLAASFTKVLDLILNHPTSTLADVNVISDVELAQAAADQVVPPAVEFCTHWQIQQQIQSQPAEPAVTSWDGDLTYAELGLYATRLALKLQELEVGPEVLVPVYFPKSTWAVVAMVAVEMAGGAFIPLDITAPQGRLQSILEDTKATLVIAARSCAGMLSDMGVEILVVDESTLSKIPYPMVAPSSTVLPHNASFVIFTSGSTGKPKGMVMQHNGVCSTAAAYGSALHIGPGTRVFQFSAYSFDVGIWDVLITLMRGGCVCMPSDHARINDLVGAINTSKANLVFLTPTVADLLSPVEVPGLEVICLGGEAVPKKLTDRWKDAVELHGMYGPAEASSCAWNPTLGKSGKSTNLGKPLYSAFWVVNPTNPREIVPAGCIGELLVQGPMLARGYLNFDEKTTANWMEDVYWLPGKALRRAYRTGDLVRRNGDGTFDYIGRKDTQVKLNGQRVELGEIEMRMQEFLPREISGIVDLLDVKSSGNGNLTAFLWLTEGPSIQHEGVHLVESISKEMSRTISELDSSLKTVLPSYMIPNTYLIFHGKPEQTISGKISRRQFVKLGHATTAKERNRFSPGAAKCEQPTTEMEFRLRDIWAQVLQIAPEHIGKKDSFLQIGGDSITAIQLVSLAHQHGIGMTIAKIFEDSRLEPMAAVAVGKESRQTYEMKPFSMLPSDKVDDIKLSIQDDCALPSEQDIEDAYPCTSLQEGLMALAVKQPGSYVAKYVYRLPTDVDAARFRTAWARTVELCGSLRTRIVLRDGASIQALIREEPTWEVTDGLDVRSVMSAAKSVEMRYGSRLCRYALVSGMSNDTYFVLIIHHAVFDGWSLNIVLDTLYHTYQGKYVPALQPYAGFLNYTTCLNHATAGKYWRAQLDGTHRATFPRTDNTTGFDAVSRIMKMTMTFPQSTDTSITKATILRAAWAIVLARYCDTDDVCFGMTVSGRHAPVDGIDRMGGPTVATVPVRVRLDRQRAVSRFL